MKTIGEVVTELIAEAKRGPQRWPVKRSGEREPIPWLVRLGVFIRDDFRCKTCGWRDETRATLELDHCIPWSAGGPDESWNLRVLCLPHNQIRSNWRTTSDFRRLLPVTWWCWECWQEPMYRAPWRDGTDLSIAPAVTEPERRVFCAWCRAITDSDLTADQFARAVDS